MAPVATVKIDGEAPGTRGDEGKRDFVTRHNCHFLSVAVYLERASSIRCDVDRQRIALAGFEHRRRSAGAIASDRNAVEDATRDVAGWTANSSPAATAALGDNPRARAATTVKQDAAACQPSVTARKKPGVFETAASIESESAMSGR